MKDNREVASKKISEIVSKINELYAEAAKIADENDIEFSVEGPAYGMGGYYVPKKTTTDSEDQWDSSDGWMASSQSC